MDPARHLQILHDQGRLVAAADPAHLGATVPTLPDWTVERVVRHLGKVHRWVAGALALAPGEGMDAIGELEPMPSGPAALESYRAALDDLVEAFEARDPTDPVATFVGPGTVGWWLRRQAHEVMVHRIDVHDAVQAAGGPAPDPVPVDAAADGIDEWARVFVATRWAQRVGELPADLVGRTVHVHGTDDPPAADGEEWLLAFGSEGVTVEASHAKGDVALRGPAADLLLVLWRRRPLEVVDVVGDGAVAELLVDRARF